LIHIIFFTKQFPVYNILRKKTRKSALVECPYYQIPVTRYLPVTYPRSQWLCYGYGYVGGKQV